ncbi:hypothetical protein CMO89_04880 [Candidatus Woesearchaeota archaeon]|mgnify:CR=1 FL=1|nr:hypothetical protein [Candidatus Woesearchaeota archaeon]|tara:strand:+ start:2653 stop:3159 length:507 start_codon:yes stop_codon:yes gene_type:complete
MPNECQVWANETREFFPALDKYIILADYGNIPKKALSLIDSKIRKRTNKEIRILSSISNSSKRIKTLRREYKVTLSKELKKIKDISLRRQVVLYTFINRLMHVEKRDLLELNNPYNKIKKKKINSMLLEEESLERYNQLRKKDNLLEIRNSQDINLAINRIMEELKVK